MCTNSLGLKAPDSTVNSLEALFVALFIFTKDHPIRARQLEFHYRVAFCGIHRENDDWRSSVANCG